jgi:SAM-dependent methyltransferase
MQDFIRWGLDRTVPELRPIPAGDIINLGPGNQKVIERSIGVGRLNNRLAEIPWEAPEPLPFDNETVAAVHAHHFLEHFEGPDALKILDEISRVLTPGGVAFITTPLQGTPLQGRALDHRSEWNEETWSWIFDRPYYDDFPAPRQLRPHAVFLAGVVSRNLCVFAQLIKF